MIRKKWRIKTSMFVAGLTGLLLMPTAAWGLSKLVSMRLADSISIALPTAQIDGVVLGTEDESSSTKPQRAAADTPPAAEPMTEMVSIEPVEPATETKEPASERDKPGNGPKKPRGSNPGLCIVNGICL